MTFDGLGFDPAPGDPGRGQDMVRRLRAATTALAQMESTLSGTGSAEWEGRAATAFYGLVDEDLRPRVTEAHQSFAAATRALDRWLIDLEDHQSRARTLEVEAEAARQDLAAAQSSADSLGDPPDDPAQKQEHEDKQKARGDAVASSRSALDEILRRGRALAAEATAAATTAAGALDTAMKLAPDEPGLLDRIGGALEGIGEFLGDVLEFVKDNWWDILHKLVNLAATVLSIASIFFPALAPFALAFAIVDVLMSGVDWARGVPGAKEAFLTGAAGLVGGFAVGKVIGAFTNLAGPALATGPFRVMASGGGAAVAAPAVAVLSYNPSFGPALAGYLVIKAKDAKDGSDAVMSLLGGNTYYSNSLADGWRKARNN